MHNLWRISRQPPAQPVCHLYDDLQQAFWAPAGEHAYPATSTSPDTMKHATDTRKTTDKGPRARIERCLLW